MFENFSNSNFNFKEVARSIFSRKTLLLGIGYGTAYASTGGALIGALMNTTTSGAAVTATAIGAGIVATEALRNGWVGRTNSSIITSWSFEDALNKISAPNIHYAICFGVLTAGFGLAGHWREGLAAGTAFLGAYAFYQAHRAGLRRDFPQP